MTFHVNDAGVWKQPTEVFVNSAGVWKPCVDLLVNNGGLWKSVLYVAGSQEFAAGSSGSFTVPSGVYSITVSVIGGGGGGHGGHNWGSGGGGSSGYYQNYTYAVTPGQAISYSVGAAGAANSNGAQGGNSVFGTLTVSGGFCPPGYNENYYGAGGSPGGTNGQTGNQSGGTYPAIAGSGASSPWGTGGAGGIGGGPGSSGSSGSPGTGYGAGGGGGGNNASGAAGSAGRLWLSW